MIASFAIVSFFALRSASSDIKARGRSQSRECSSRFTSKILKDRTSQSKPAQARKVELSTAYLNHTASIDGWMCPIHHHVVKSLSDAQTGLSISGLIGEIGVHHGKFFFSLATNLVPDEYAVAFDIFEEQSMNVDGSGNGSLEIFNDHAKKIGFDTEAIQVVKGDTNHITDTHLKKVSATSYRIFSIDGGHTRATTLNDLFLAQSILHNAGFTVLDDFINDGWLGVVDGLFTYINKCNSELRPFLWLCNKLYLSHKSWQNFYLEQVKSFKMIKCSSTSNIHDSRFSINQYKVCVVQETI